MCIRDRLQIVRGTVGSAVEQARLCAALKRGEAVILAESNERRTVQCMPDPMEVGVVEVGPFPTGIEGVRCLEQRTGAEDGRVRIQVMAGTGALVCELLPP